MIPVGDPGVLTFLLTPQQLDVEIGILLLDIAYPFPRSQQPPQRHDLGIDPRDFIIQRLIAANVRMVYNCQQIFLAGGTRIPAEIRQPFDTAGQSQIRQQAKLRGARWVPSNFPLACPKVETAYSMGFNLLAMSNLFSEARWMKCC